MANDPIKLVDVGALDRFKTDIENEIPESIQYSTMPTASADLVGSIVQFTGTTGTYHNGYFYKCQAGSTSGTYEWVAVSVQAGGGGSSVQSDWNQTDSAADDYIKNKPDLTEHLPIISTLETKTSASVSIDDISVAIDVTWNGLTSFSGIYIWTDGTDIYYSSGSKQYVLDKSTSTWTAKTWTGLTSLIGDRIWTDGTDIYYSYSLDQYVLDKSTSTWTAKTWTGLTSFVGFYIWTDGTDIYYSQDSDQYVLDKSTSTWTAKTWTGLTSLMGNSIWTDGTDIYYSSGSTQYVLDKAASTWTAKTWTGLTSFNGIYIWTDGTDIYYSSSSKNKKIIIKRHINNDFNSSSVQSDWNQTDSTVDDYIKNKPTLGSAAALDVATSGDASSSQVVKGNDTRLSDSRTPTNHASNKVTSLTGYSKPSSTSAITTSDSLNTALGKLEKGLDGKADNLMTNYSIAALEEAIATTDTKDEAIGKLEKGLQNRAKTVDITYIIQASSWTGASAPYSYTLAITGSGYNITSSMKPIIDVVPSDTVQTGLDQIEQFGYISKAVTGTDTITFYCYEDKPDIDLPISIKLIW